MKQEDRRRQTNKLLLDTTIELIREKGCHDVTMKDIMDRSGLSKGAIFHYVKSKDEIFARVLQDRLEETNRRFMDEVDPEGPTFEGPMEAIADSLPALEDPGDVTNKVLIYLLGRDDQPMVADVLRQFYERSVELSRQWIVTGQSHGVIPQSVDPDRSADLFVLLSLGLRVRSSLPHDGTSFGSRDFSLFIAQILKSR